ncbi:thiamine pyrophosphate-dependent enzyme [Brevibacterium ravenspurgense]|uniref:thiamine pyrophosphate-dependent enzyme n=1 Tax=Brevibacterium ravenspurgense TaxID=479117 RepID=UPI0009EF386B|nr:thiamine pyrophosphate-dependent enzyme [Brevibacterium ravenspurgense]
MSAKPSATAVQTSLSTEVHHDPASCAGEHESPLDCAVREGGHALVEQLVASGVTRVFGVPGESYLSVIDGLYDHTDDIEIIVTRQEGGAAMAAAAHGALTGEPGICMVTRGPGATNASIGVHVAKQDASPMVLFIGQIPRDHQHRESFQEVNYRQMFGELAKEVIEINTVERVPELTVRALNAAVSGEPGPVVVVLPEDMLVEQTDAPLKSRTMPAPVQPDAHSVQEAHRLLSEAEKPLIILGSTGYAPELGPLVTDYCERNGIALAAAHRRMHLVDNSSPAYAGTFEFGRSVLENNADEADLIFFLGSRPDPNTGEEWENYRGGAANGQAGPGVIHVYPDPNVIGRFFPAHVGTAASPLEFMRALVEHEGGASAGAGGSAAAADGGAAGGGAGDSALAGGRRAWQKKLHDDWAGYIERNLQTSLGGPFMQKFNARFDAETIITNGAGNYTAWVQKNRTYSTFPSHIASQSGSMGYGIPAALAAALEHRDRTVVTFAGDGCFMMNGQELATMAANNLDVLVIVVNNSLYGTIHMHQEREYPGRPVFTSLDNPDFAALGAAYGARTAKVSTPEEFDAALAEFASAPGLRFIEVVTEGY